VKQQIAKKEAALEATQQEIKAAEEKLEQVCVCYDICEIRS
jgi:hypothetical protein